MIGRKRKITKITEWVIKMKKPGLATKQEEKLKFRLKWYKGRIATALFVFWLICTGGAGLINQYMSTVLGSAKQQVIDVAWITLVMLISVSICMVWARQDWSLKKRIIVISLAIPAEYLLTMFTSILEILTYLGGRNYLGMRVTYFAASLIVFIYAMRHSRLFVERTNVDVATDPPTLPNEGVA